MSNAASVIVTLGAILLGLLVMNQVHHSANLGWDQMTIFYLGAIPVALLAFAGSLIGYAVGHWRGHDEAYTSIVGTLAGGIGVPVLIGVVVLLLNLSGFFK
jgi:carbohydrate-binding DOMON domain-containing protein